MLLKKLKLLYLNASLISGGSHKITEATRTHQVFLKAVIDIKSDTAGTHEECYTFMARNFIPPVDDGIKSNVT